MTDYVALIEEPEADLYLQEQDVPQLQVERLNAMQAVLDVIKESQSEFRTMLEDLESKSGFTLIHYQRYLSLQYHFTKEVQRDFISVAAHHSLNSRRRLREFLFNFAQEEEPHYLVAERDLKSLGVELLPCPLDVSLWQAWYRPQISTRPFYRLGATCVLENLGPGISDIGKRLFSNAKFITPQNSRFFTIHFHEALPHGDQIIKALTSVYLKPEEIEELVQGAVCGAVLYLRMARWVFGTDSLNERFRGAGGI